MVGKVDTDAGLDHVDGDEADDECQRGDDFEVDQRAESHPPDDLHVTGTGYPRDQRREDQRRDDHLDQPEEELAEGPEIDGGCGVVLADQPAGNDPKGKPDEYLLRERETAARCRRSVGLCHPVRSSGRVDTSASIRRFYPECWCGPGQGTPAAPAARSHVRRAPCAVHRTPRRITRDTASAPSPLADRGRRLVRDRVDALGSSNGNRHSSSRPPSAQRPGATRPTSRRRFDVRSARPRGHARLEHVRRAALEEGCRGPRASNSLTV